jgi:hypothetical protein
MPPNLFWKQIKILQQVFYLVARWQPGTERIKNTEYKSPSAEDFGFQMASENLGIKRLF